MSENKIEKPDLSILTNLELGPNWEEPANKFKEKNQVKKNKTKYIKKNSSAKKEKSKLSINITYDHESITKIKDRIRLTGISYSVEEIVEAIVSKKERLSFKMENLGDNTFIIVKHDGKIFTTKSATIDHIISDSLNSLITKTETRGEKPSGNFNTILKCPITKKLLPPKSYHDFENRIYQHMHDHKIDSDYKNYVNKLAQESDKEVVEKWKDNPPTQFIYELKSNFSIGKKYNSIKSLRNEIDRNFENLVLIKKNVLVSGKKIDILEKVLVNQLKLFYDNNFQWKKDIFFNILINLKKSGFHIFKFGEKNNMFASPRKPKIVIDNELSKICLKIINLVRDSKIISKKDVLNLIYSDKVKKDVILFEIKWLIKEGYIKKFKNDTLSII